ncbi:hypothetical protein GCM10027268_02730 [Brachybacterium huguangmaarense]
MRILRHGQACIEVIEGATRIVIDPGALGTPVDPTGATAVLVTHDHVDHADHDLLARARQRDPDLRILGPAPLAAALDPPIETVAEGDELAIGPVPVRVVGRRQEPGSLQRARSPTSGTCSAGGCCTRATPTRTSPTSRWRSCRCRGRGCGARSRSGGSRAIDRAGWSGSTPSC